MKNNKSIYIVGIFMLITMVSVGYAILTGQLNINGTAKVKAASWDIYFNNIKIKDGSVIASVKPSITDKTTVNFEVDLEKPGDFYEFNVDVVNDGDLDAMIESINITPELTLNQQKYLSYAITYLDDVPLEEKDILHAKKFRTLKVRVEYLKSVGNGELNSNDETINIKATIKYVQADNTAKTPTSQEKDIDKAAPVIENATANVTQASKDTEVIITFEANDENEIIDTLTANDIIVKVGGTQVTPTTKVLTSSGINQKVYALTLSGIPGKGELTLVIDGTKISDEDGNTSTSTTLTSGVTITSIVNAVTGTGSNIGDEITIGNEHFYVISNDGTDAVLLTKYNLNATPKYDLSTTYKQNTNTTISPVPFVSRGYWSNPANETYEYVYDDRSNISQYVNNYKAYLESLGAQIKEARLINYDELVGLGCEVSWKSNKYCSEAPLWLRTTAYWTGLSSTSSGVWYMYGNDSILISRASYDNNTSIGVRPVIVIPASAI